MHPILLELGPWTVRSYDVALALSIATSTLIVWRAGRKIGYQGFRMAICLAGAILCALLGARINGWLFFLGGEVSLLNLNIAATSGGMTAFGGYAGALGFAALFSLWSRWNIPRLLDIMAPALVLGEGIQRVGCLLNGCCFGRQTSSPLGMYLPDSFGRWAYRYPTQIITGIFCITLFAWLWRKRGTRPFDGALMLYYLVIYNMGRVLIDFMRGDEPTALGFLTAHQVTATLIALAAALALFFLLEHPKNTTSSEI